jgi:2-polyprenyl-3-methyl-5-hydroxy-6-metoxy-1,4-benzoquinol methylase
MHVACPPAAEHITPDTQLEQTPCPLCGCADASRRLHAAFAPFAIARCAGCGFHYLSPRLTEAQMRARYAEAAYYAAPQGATGYAAYTDQEHTMRKTARRTLRRLHASGVHGDRLLEVGCGYGYFLSEAAAYFARRDATELAPAAIAHARAHADRVFCGGLEQVPAAERYDLIVADQVLEHIYAPREFAADLLARLAPGGHLLLVTPDYASPWRRLLRARWPSYKIPEHVLYFERRSLHRLLRDAGAREVRAFDCTYAFPLGLLLAQAGVRVAAPLARTPIWVPRTEVACLARA